MADTEYKINYSAPPAKIERDVDRILAKLRALDVQIDKSKAKLKSLGSDTSGLTKMMSGLVKLDRELQRKVTDATKAEKALAGVGKGNRSVADLTKRLKELEEQLKAVTSAATAATPATAAVGAGGGGKGGAGGGGTGGGLLGRGAGLARPVAAYAAYRLARKVGGAIGDSSGDRRSFFGEATKLTGEFRQDLQALAVLQDKKSADDALIREQLQFQKQTGLNADEAMSFRLEFGGAVAPGKARGNITDATADELEKQAALFGKRYDIDPMSAGRMAGLLPNYGKVPSAKAGLGMMAEAAEQLNVYGLGSPRAMMPPLIGLSADMLDSEEGGRFSDYASLAARFGATTFKAKSPAAAATQIRQANRLLRKFNGKDEEAFLRKHGVTPEDDYESALRKITPSISGPDADQVLAKAGFANSTERDSVIKQADMNKVVDEARKDPRMAAARANAGKLNADYLATIPAQQVGAENAEFAATIEAGLAGEKLRTARAHARARMIQRDTLKPGVFGKLADYAVSATTGGGISGEDLRVDQEAINSLVQGGQKVGVDVLGKFPGLDFGPRLLLGGNDEKAITENFSRASQAVEAAGGDPFGGAPKNAAQAAKQAAQALGNLGNALNAMGQPKNQGGANQGGAGFNPARR
ncbi:hypothetical protein P12x_003052 [Tundrisphaera lichenicola]|uniref:hypothetical protein n=1 Tax=Tundrisphaera lichenicola TaxID=2029860 RepID=UPI003EBBF2C1